MATITTSSGSQTQNVFLTDGQLLDRFVEGGDQEAFAALIQRHGSMVLGVCRRVLHHDQDTEDAFQATAVVLARKASTISKHQSVSSWLYRVAYRIALRMGIDKARRRAKEQQLPPRDAEAGLGDVIRRELQQVLDEEVHRLPEKYRAPILLCYLQGQTNEEAAALLRCPTGTVKIRLLRGREMLRKRLVRRGLALSVTLLLADALRGLADVAVPDHLVRATLEAVSGGAPAAVSGLAVCALKSMCLAKLKVAAVVLLTLSILCLTDSLLNRAAGAPDTHIHRPFLPDALPTAVQNTVVACTSD